MSQARDASGPRQCEPHLPIFGADGNSGDETKRQGASGDLVARATLCECSRVGHLIAIEGGRVDRRTAFRDACTTSRRHPMAIVRTIRGMSSTGHFGEDLYPTPSGAELGGFVGGCRHDGLGRFLRGAQAEI